MFSEQFFIMSGWIVAVFLEDNCIATIPELWIVNNNDNGDKTKMVYWPQKTRNVTPLVKRRQIPADNWPTFEVRILGKYDSYETALKKSQLAEETSDLSAIDEKNDKPRIRKKNRKFSSSDDQDSEIESDLGNMPKFPRFLKNSVKTNEDVVKKVNATSSSSSQRIETPIIFPNKPGLNLHSTDDGHSLHQLGTPTFSAKPFQSELPLNTPKSSANVINDTDLLRKLLNKINLVLGRLGRIDERVNELYTMISEQEKTVNIGQNTIDDEHEMEYNDLLPINNDEELGNLNLYLQLENNNKLMAKQFSRIGGNTSKELTKRIMYRSMTNSFGELYSWEGGKGKRKFKDLKLASVIMNAVRLNQRTKDACDDEIITTIKMWLVKAKERRINGEKKQNNDEKIE